jgi:hypothetical protein
MGACVFEYQESRSLKYDRVFSLSGFINNGGSIISCCVEIRWNKKKRAGKCCFVKSIVSLQTVDGEVDRVVSLEMLKLKRPCK